MRPVERIGFVGLGQMGLPMCAGLVRAGFDVTGYDARPDLASAAAAAGARWADRPADVAAGQDLLVTMLPGPGEVQEAMLGPAGLLAALPAGAVWLDMTSNSPLAARPVRERALSLGIEVREAPVGGGVAGARDGNLQLFVGGDPDILARCRPVLDVLADRVFHVGPHGAGHTTKLLVNLLWFGQAVATAEALLLGGRAHRPRCAPAGTRPERRRL